MPFGQSEGDERKTFWGRESVCDPTVRRLRKGLRKIRVMIIRATLTETLIGSERLLSPWR